MLPYKWYSDINLFTTIIFVFLCVFNSSSPYLGILITATLINLVCFALNLAKRKRGY